MAVLGVRAHAQEAARAASAKMAAMDAASEERLRSHEEGMAALGAQYEERLAAAQRYAATAPNDLVFRSSQLARSRTTPTF